MLKVLHIASHTINVGDGALNLVIQSRLRRLSPRPLAFTHLDSALDPLLLAAADVDEYDLVVVGGGGAINNNARAAHNGVEFPMTLDEYQKARVPFAFVALGHNAFPGETLRHTAALARLVGLAANRGDPFSVRNDGSLARLARDIGDAAKTVVEIPDPGFFVGSPALPPVEASGRPYLLLQAAADRLMARLEAGAARRLLGCAWPLGIAGLADGFSEFALAMWREHGLDILVAPHIPADLGLATAIIERLYRRAGASAAHRPFRLMGTPHPSHAAQFFGAYAAAALVVGMRGHAAICAVGLHRPFVALATHQKISGFMETCGLGAWSVPVRSGFAQELFRKSSELLRGGTETYLALRDRHTVGFDNDLDNFLSMALARVG